MPATPRHPDPAQPPAGAAPQAPQRILIIRPSALGDVCRTTPVLASLRAAFPTARIDWLVHEAFADAIRAHPALTGIIPFARRAMGRWWTPAGLAATRDLLTRLRAPRYDLVLDCQGLARSALFTRLTGAPRRIGHADAREGAPLAYTTRVAPAPGDSPHTVDRMLGLVAALGITPLPDARLYAPPDDLAALADDTRLACGVARYVLFAPTSRWPGKRWPIDRFIDLARGLADPSLRVDAIAVVAASGERDQCAPLLSAIPGAPPVIDLVGKTTVGRLMAIVSRAALVVASDSAALHMAVGFDRPLLGLFGPTDVARVGPYRRDADVIWHLQPGDILDHKNEPLGRILMERITADEVLAACAARLRSA